MNYNENFILFNMIELQKFLLEKNKNNDYIKNISYIQYKLLKGSYISFPPDNKICQVITFFKSLNNELKDDKLSYYIINIIKEFEKIQQYCNNKWIKIIEEFEAEKVLNILSNC